MARLKAVDPAKDQGPGAEILRGPLKNKQLNIFKGMAANPGVLKAFLAFVQGVQAGALTPEEHEIVALVTGQRRDCQYCLAAHTQMAQQAGLSQEEVLNVRRGHGRTDKQQALINFVESVVDRNGFIDDEDLDAFRRAGYNDAAVVEVLAAIAVNTFTNLFNHVNQTPIDFPEPAEV